MEKWQFLLWILWLSNQCASFPLEAYNHAKGLNELLIFQRYESFNSDHPFRWSVDVALFHDVNLQFYWTELSFTNHIVQHFELKAFSNVDTWSITHAKNISATAHEGFLGDLLPGVSYTILFSAVYANWSTYVSLNTMTTKSNAPSEVRNIRITKATINSLTVEWDPPLQTGGVLEKYLMTITYKENGTAKVIRKINRAPVTTRTIFNLPSDSEVEVRMQAKTLSHIRGADSIAGRRSEPLRVRTLADPARLNWTVNVVPGNESTLLFTWSPSLSGAEQLQRIELKATGSVNKQKTHHTTAISATVREGLLGGLLPGRKYETLLVAVYDFRSIEMYAGLQSTKPHAPGDVRDFRGESATSNSLSLTWLPPLQFGEELTYYDVKVLYNKTGQTLEEVRSIRGSRTEYMPSRLPADCDIVVQIRARTTPDVMGELKVEGNWSNMLHLKTYADPAQSNWSVKVKTANESTLQFDWTPPLFELNELLGMELEAYSTTAGGRKMSYKKKINPATRQGFLDGLLPGRLYETFLTALYAKRNITMYVGEHSTKARPPTAPINIKAEAVSFNSINLVWEPPMQPGGYLDKYELLVQYQMTDDYTVEASRYIPSESTACVVDQLPADSDIQIKIQSGTKSTGLQRDRLEGQWSEPIHVKTSAAPLDLSSVDVEPINSNSLYFNWTNSIFEEAGLQRFELKVSDTSDETPLPHSINVTASKRTGILGGLIPGRTYETAIVAVYENCSYENFTGLHRIPTKDYFEIRNIKVEAESATAIRLSWDAPFQEDVKILAFVINLQFNRTDISMANGDHYVAATESTYRITKLPTDCEINVKVRMITRYRLRPDENVAERWSKVVWVKTYPVPSAPFNVTAVAFNATAVHICWQPPHNIGRKLDYYKMVLQYKGDFSSYQSMNVKTGPFKNCWVVDDLPSETEIAVTIAAVVREKEQGAMSNEGTWSDAVHVTTLPDLLQVYNFKVKVENSSTITLSWEPPFEQNLKILHYVINLQINGTDTSGSSGDHTVPAKDYTHVISDLPANSKIDAKIKMVTQSRLRPYKNIGGNWSEVVHVKTNAVVPRSQNKTNYAVTNISQNPVKTTSTADVPEPTGTARSTSTLSLLNIIATTVPIGSIERFKQIYSQKPVPSSSNKVTTGTSRALRTTSSPNTVPRRPNTVSSGVRRSPIITPPLTTEPTRPTTVTHGASGTQRTTPSPNTLPSKPNTVSPVISGSRSTIYTPTMEPTRPTTVTHGASGALRKTPSLNTLPSKPNTVSTGVSGSRSTTYSLTTVPTKPTTVQPGASGTLPTTPPSNILTTPSTPPPRGPSGIHRRTPLINTVTSRSSTFPPGLRKLVDLANSTSTVAITSARVPLPNRNSPTPTTSPDTVTSVSTVVPPGPRRSLIPTPLLNKVTTTSTSVSSRLNSVIIELLAPFLVVMCYM